MKMKFNFLHLLFLSHVFSISCTDTFDDDGLTFSENSNNTFQNETESDFYDVAIVDTDETI